MTPQDFCKLAERLMRCPTAPYHEHAVRDVVEAICDENRLDCRRDKFGNVLVQLRTTPRQRPLVLAAHMDHPGFEVVGVASGQAPRVRFNGGVPDAFFRLGLRLRLAPSGTAASLGRRIGKQKVFKIKSLGTPVSASAKPGMFATWELEPFGVRAGRIYGCACDNLIGVAATLATLIELKRKRARVHVIGMLTRAEEVGFRGALAAGASRELPANSLVVSLETSRELEGVRMGHGVILRVGDCASVFDAAASRFLAEVALKLAGRDKRFKFQRGLMSGGTCEATAYQELGYQATGVCVALGNYHNCGPRNKIAAEYVDLADACSMVNLLAKAAKEMRRHDALVSRLPRRLEKLRREAEKRLEDTA